MAQRKANGEIRKTPEKDVKRLAEKIRNNENGRPLTKGDFRQAYIRYMGKPGPTQQTLFDSVLDKYDEDFGIVQSKKRVARKRVGPRRAIIKIRGKERTIYRDDKGRFAKRPQ